MDVHAGRVLVVDDDRSVQSVGRAILERMGFVVETCGDGMAALQHLDRTSYDLLLIDLHLPDVGGVEVLEHIQQRASSMAIIVITGYASIEDTARTTLLGAQGIILKPFTADALRDVIHEVLRKRDADHAAVQAAAFHPLLRISERLLSELDLPRLCDQIVQTALGELHADYALLMLRDGETGRVEVAASAGVTSALPADVHRDAAQWVMAHRQPLLLGATTIWPEALQHLHAALQHQSVLCVPLVARDQVLGVLYADRRGGATIFTPANQDLLVLLAGQIAIALENARLYSLAQRRADRFKKLNNLSTALTATLDLDQVLRIATEHLQQELPIASGCIVLHDEWAQQGRQHYTFGACAQPDLQSNGGTVGGLAGQVLADGQPRIANAARQAPVLAAWERNLVAAEDQALLCVALATDKRIDGVIELAGRPGVRFGDEDVQFVAAVAAPVALAIEKARMYATVVRSEARYRALLEHARDAVLLLDGKAQTIVDANPAAVALSGYTRDALMRLDPSRLIVPLPPRDMLARLHESHGNGAPEFETHIHTHDGRDLPVAVGLSEVVHDGMSYLLLIARDMSERQRLAQRLVQTEKLAGMGRLAASIAHEINNPLQGLQNSLHLILNRSLEGEKRDHILGKARDEVEQLVLLVQRLLGFYRPSVEGRRPIALTEVIEHVLALTDTQLQQSNIVVERDLEPHLPRVMGVGSHLKQVFLSLVLNAIDAMPEGGRLTIRTHVQESYPGIDRPCVLVEVADTGPGIPGDEIPKIFEPFYTTRTNRTGLGLAISYSIVEKHEGSLSASNTPEGALFCVVLPAI